MPVAGDGAWKSREARPESAFIFLVTCLGAIVCVSTEALVDSAGPKEDGYQFWSSSSLQLAPMFATSQKEELCICLMSILLSLGNGRKGSVSVKVTITVMKLHDRKQIGQVMVGFADRK